jgi:translocation and assembly module TamB
MSDAVDANATPQGPQGARRSRWRAAAIAALVLIALLVAAVWYTETPQFENLVRGKVVAELQRMTGGRVDLGAFHWHLLHLEFTADNLTIHGLEARGQIPYAHIDRLYVRLKVISFLRHEIGMDYLEADRPVFHLIVYRDGTTNQPHPLTREVQRKPAIDTIFELKINQAELRDGVMIVNERKMPFSAAAKQVGVTLEYRPAIGLKGKERYLGSVHVEDLSLRRGNETPEQSVMDMQLELERNQLTVRQFTMRTGKQQLALSGSLTNFANPQWKFQAKGTVDLAEVEALSGISGLTVGRVDLELHGSGTRASFTVDGKSKVTGAAYHAGSIHLTGVNADTRLHITQDELALNDMHARLQQGGSVEGQMRVTDWLGNAQGTAKKKTRGMIRAKLHGIPLTSVMAVVAPPHYTDLGFDTQADGLATVDWTGSAQDFVAAARVTLMPPVRTTPGRVPMYGSVDAAYSNANGSVTIRDLDVHTPSSRVQVTGTLGVYPITRPSKLTVLTTSADLGEFDKALTTLGVMFKGKKGTEVIPVTLHGKMVFAGTLTDSILSPDVKGHVSATNLDFNFSNPWQQPGSGKPGTASAAQVRSIHLDSVDGDAEYSARKIDVKGAVITHGSAVAHVSGELDAHELRPRHYAFDGKSGIRADVSVQGASLADLSAVAGEKVPATGTLDLQAHTGGLLDDLTGGGTLSLRDGTIYGEPYTRFSTDVKFAGQQVNAVNLVFLEDGGRITGSGGYDLKSGVFHFDARGGGFDLARIHRLQSSKYSLAGKLAFEAQGSGTLHAPMVEAKLHLTQLNLDKASTGTIEAEAHTQGRKLLMQVHANLSNAQVQANAETQLAGDLQTKAQVSVTGLNVEPVLTVLNVQGITMHSSIGATLKVNGPLRTPRKLNGDIQVQQMALSVAGVPLKSDGTIHATLTDGSLHLDPLHITGEDTNLRAEGSVGILTEAHAMNLHASGSVNMKLVQTLDEDVTGSGHVDFNVDGNGTFAHPGLTGKVKFTNVALSLQDFPNGLSKMNGTLEFDQDRLDVKDLTAESGGGRLTLGGFVTYQQGLYGNLTATAQDVRIRYPQGVSSMANAQLRLQGTGRSALLSGNVTITRFVVGSGLDLAGFSKSAGSVTMPPNVNAPSNRLRLDIHVVSAPQLDFQNSYAKLAGDVNVRVRGTLAQPTVLGHIAITEGSASFAGTKYELQHGDIYFSNPIKIDPTIDLSATARVEDYDITVGLTGTASNPVPTFRSEPPLSEQDIFSLLALGRTQQEQQIYSTMQSQAGVNSTADALLGGALNATVSSRIQKLFGGGSVKIDPTFVSGAGNSTARITVEQQISKNATLTYATNVNSTAQQLIQGQLNITQNLSIVAVRDEAGVFSLIFKLRRRYR